MKLKRLALLAITTLSTLGMAACGGSTSSTTTSSTASATSSVAASTTETSSVAASSTKEEVTISYQFTGENTEMAAYGMAYTYYLNLYSDGTLDGYGYAMYSLDTTDAATNTSFTKWYEGKWAESVDDNDDKAIKAIVNYCDGVKSMTGEALTGKFTYTISYATDGVTPLPISNFSVPLGISGRQVTLEYNATPYATANEFIAATVYKFTAPTTYAALFEETTTKERIYLYADNTGENFGARLNKDGTLKGYYPTAKPVAWAYTDGALTITLNGTVHTVTVDGTTGTMTWEEAIYGDYKATYNFACSDISALIASESGGTGEETVTYPQGTLYFDYTAIVSSQLKARFTCSAATWSAAGAMGYTAVAGDTDVLFSFTQEVEDGGTASMTFDCLKDGTYKFAYSTYHITETGTWTFASYSFTYTGSDNVAHKANMAH